MIYTPVYAYAGPGVAIGAIIVAITVLIAFFSSLIIRLFNFLKSTFKYLIKKFLPKKNLSKKLKSFPNKKKS